MKDEYMTYTYRYGSGVPLYIVNGGPGLEHSYLKDFFMPLIKEREIVFYDQIGTGRDFDMSIRASSNEFVRQLIQLLQNDDRRKDIVAHSWGTYLTISALMDPIVNEKIDRVILINPFALDYRRYEESAVRLAKRFPQVISKRMEELAEINTKESYLQLMRLIAPYYTYQCDRDYNFEFESYNSPIEDEAYRSLHGFDHVPLISRIKGKIYVIKCDDDFISIDDTAELQQIAAQSVFLNKCGHFPFIEQQEQCYKYLLEFLHDE